MTPELRIQLSIHPEETEWVGEMIVSIVGGDHIPQARFDAACAAYHDELHVAASKMLKQMMQEEE